MLAFFDKYGIEYSSRKSVRPSQLSTYVGVHVDTVANCAQVLPERAERYGADIAALLECAARSDGWVDRLHLASVRGKVGFVAEVSRAMGQHVSVLDRCLVDFEVTPEVGKEWGSAVRVGLGVQGCKALEGIAALLTQPAQLRRRYYPHSDPALAGFWKGQCVDSHAYMDQYSRTSNGVPVITGDASGTGWGVHYDGKRALGAYSVADAAPNRSSNWRELDTAVKGLEKWGGTMRAGPGEGRALVRSDNSTTVAVINKQATSSAHLVPLLRKLRGVCEEHGLEVAALHIPGVENDLADWLSRFVRKKDYGDWMLHPSAFAQALATVRRVFWGDDGPAGWDEVEGRVGRSGDNVVRALDAQLVERANFGISRGGGAVSAELTNSGSGGENFGMSNGDLNFGLGKEGEGPDLGAGRGESSGGRMGRFRFTLDGCCDPSGSNSHVERFCSFVDSVLERDLRGEALWANPDYSDGRFVGRILRHFLEAYADVDYVTSGTFTLPAWVWALWWRLLRGGARVGVLPAEVRTVHLTRLEKVGEGWGRLCF